MRHCLQLLTLIALLPLVIFGCNKPKEVEDVRPVRTVVVGSKVHAASGVVTGQVTAHAYVNASFRVPGKLSQRMVSAGSAVKAGTASGSSRRYRFQGRLDVCQCRSFQCEGGIGTCSKAGGP